MATSLAGVTGLVAPHSAFQSHTSEDGYRLWLRYASPGEAASRRYRRAIRQIVVQGKSSSAEAIRKELTSARSTILGEEVRVAGDQIGNGALIVGTPTNSSAIQGLRWQKDLAGVGPEGYL